MLKFHVIGLWEKLISLWEGRWSGFYFRSSCLQAFSIKSVLKNFTIFFGKLLYPSFFSLSLATLSKKRLRYRCFPLNFEKFLRTIFFIEHLWWLLLLFASRSHLQNHKTLKEDTKLDILFFCITSCQINISMECVLKDSVTDSVVHISPSSCFSNLWL